MISIVRLVAGNFAIMSGEGRAAEMQDGHAITYATVEAAERRAREIARERHTRYIGQIES